MAVDAARPSPVSLLLRQLHASTSFLFGSKLVFSQILDSLWRCSRVWL